MAFNDRFRDAFLAVSHHGSIGRAAEALNMSQPTLSRMIKRLEQRIGVPLFDRYPNGVMLNVYGEALLPFASRIETESTHGLDEIERIRNGSIGVLRIGTAPSVGMSILPAIIHRMIAENPLLKIEMLEGVQDALEPALISRKVDVVIALQLTESEDILRLEDSFGDYGSVIVSSTHPIRERAELTLADLAGIPWVVTPAGTQPRRSFERIVERLSAECNAPPPRIVVETWSVSMMKALVMDSGFLAWIPNPLYEVEARAGLISDLPVKGMTVERRLHIYRRKQGLVPPAVQRFLDIVRELANHAP